MARGANRQRREWRTRGILGLAGIAILALVGWVAYNATSGLPWESPYEITAEVPNANRLIEANDVRIGGIRVGQVADVEAVPAADGKPAHARVRLKIDRDVGPLPVDSEVTIRPASVLGATYVEVELGQSSETVPEGGALGLERAAGTVELTDLLDVFDEATARSFRAALRESATGLAARGRSLNAAMGSVAALLGPLERVMRTVAAPATGLGRLLTGWDEVTAQLARVGPQLAGVVSGGAATFGALAGEREALGRAIAAAPGAEAAATEALRELRPGLSALASLARELEPAGRRLPAALEQVNATLEEGVPTIRELPEFSGELRDGLTALRNLGRFPATHDSLRKLTDLAEPTARVLEVLTPAQTECNAIAVYGMFGAAFGVLGVDHGPGLSNLILTTSGGVGEALQNPRPSFGLGINPIPNVNEHECESGNEPFGLTGHIGNPPGLQSKQTRKFYPPPGVPDLARSAGLLDDPEGAP